MIGIIAEAEDDKTFFFGTLVQAEVEEAMTQMGYGCSEYWLQFGELVLLGQQKPIDVVPKQE